MRDLNVAASVAGERTRLIQSVLPGTEAILRRLHRYDGIALSAALAAVQLMPENTPFTARLTAASNLAALVPPQSSRAVPDLSWLNRGAFASERGLGRLDDPYEDQFTDSLPFPGGPYTILPGREGGRGWLLGLLLRALHFADDSPVPPAGRPDRTALVVLRLSEGMAQRAGLRVGLGDRATERRRVTLPDRGRADELGRAVRWSAEDLATLIDPGDLADLTPLVRTRVHRGALPGLLANEDAIRPIWRVDREYVITHPLALVDRLCRTLIGQALKETPAGVLASALHRTAAGEVERALRRFGWFPLGPDAPLYTEHAVISQQNWLFDRGRVAQVILISDGLADWRWGRRWNGGSFGSRIQDLVRAAREKLDSREELLSLVVVQHAGRWLEVSSGPSVLAPSHQYLAVGAEDLALISSVDADSLSLWKLCLAAQRAEASVELVVHSIVGLYHAFRQTDGKLGLLADEAAARPGRSDLRPGVLIQPGGAGELRNEILDRFDRHFEEWVLPGSFVEVWRISADPPAALYVVEGCDRAARLCRGYRRPVWVVGPTETDGKVRWLYETLVDVVSYWLWQLSLIEMTTMGDESGPLVVTIEADDHRAWLDGSEPTPSTDSVTALPSDSGISVRLGAGLIPALRGPDNAGERRIMRDVLAALAEVAGRPLGSDRLGQLIDAAMPLGPKRRIPADADDPALDPTGLPQPRELQPYDRNLLMHLTAREVLRAGWQPGHIEAAEAGRLLKHVVSWSFDRAIQSLRELRSAGRLELLLTFNERFLMEHALESATIDSEVRCWSGEEAVFRRLSTSSQERGTSAAAVRFLIELATATQPSGSRPLDLMRYDELVALAIQIMEFGTTSDSLFYGLSNEGIFISPAGILIPSEDQVPPFHQDLGEAVLRDRLERRLGALPPAVDREAYDPQAWSELDRAFEREMGLGLDSLFSVLVSFWEMGSEQPMPAKIIDRERAVGSLASANGWSRVQAEKGIDFWAMGSRPDLLHPPEPYRAQDVYPWRHNRELSLLRRPLLLRAAKEGTEILWGQRQIKMSAVHVLELCRWGRLRRTRGGDVDRALGRLRTSAALRFNDMVASLFESPRFKSRKRFAGLPGIPLLDASGDLGDIDVLVADLRTRTLWAIETKDLGGARTPYEIAHEFRTFGQADSGADRILARQQRRARWLHLRQDSVLKYLGIVTTGPWDSDWIFVSDAPLALASMERRVRRAAQLARAIFAERADLLG